MHEAFHNNKPGARLIMENFHVHVNLKRCIEMVNLLLSLKFAPYIIVELIKIN